MVGWAIAHHHDKRVRTGRAASTYDRVVVTLRLFAHLREIAGTGRVEVDAADLADVLAEACRRFGPEFEAGLRSASVWVDGEPLEDAADGVLRPGAEVALIPPVSGGAGVADAGRAAW